MRLPWFWWGNGTTAKIVSMEHDELEELFGGEWAEWYRLTPQQRFAAQDQMWATYLLLGGSFDPEPDSQSPFHETYLAFGVYDYDKEEREQRIKVIRRSAV